MTVESVSNTRRKLYKHFKKVPEPFYGHTEMTSAQIFDMEYRYSKKKTNMCGYDVDWEINRTLQD